MIPNPTYGSFDSATYGHDFNSRSPSSVKGWWDVIEACHSKQ